MTAKKHILVFIDWYVPGHKAGGPIRSVFNLVEALKDRYNFSIVTANTDLGSDKAYEGITPNVWTLTPEGHRVMYLSGDEQRFWNIKALIKEAKPDIVYINGIFSWYFSILPLFIAKVLCKCKVVVSVRGMLHRSALSIKRNKKLMFLAFTRGLGLYRNITLHATNEEEKLEIEHTLGKNFNIKIAQNIPAPLPAYDTLPHSDKKASQLRLIWVARIAPEKNALLLLDILAQCKFPVSLDVYGTALDTRYLEQFRENIKNLPHTAVVNLKGHIEPSGVSEALINADVFILPTKGENFGHAIFEAFSHAMPVIISDNTPWRNLAEKKAGHDLPVDIAAFVTALESFYQMDNATFKQWQRGAYDLAEAHIRNSDTASDYTRIFG